MFQPRRLLHPTDFTESSRFAFEVALDLARHHAAPLLVLHVVESLGPSNVTYGEVASRVQPEGYQQRLMNDLTQMAAPADSGVEVRHLIVEGEPAEEIDRVAQEEQCDLIVMGSHKHTALGRLFLGSTADAAAAHAPCPVLVVRLPNDRKH